MNRNGNANAGDGAAQRRQPTPASPSPSPEPTGGAGDAKPNLTSLETLEADADPLSQRRDAPFHESLNLGADDPSDVYRQEAEDATRKVIDALYELAACSADVQPGEENLLSGKVNETVAHLGALFDISQQHAETSLLPFIPEDILEAIDEGRNPDTWSKNRLARLVSDNQQLAGQRWAMERYRTDLSGRVAQLFPELEGVVENIDAEHRALRTRVGGDSGSGGGEGQQPSGGVKAEQ